MGVAPSRSPDTPDELSPSKNMRSPASDARLTMTSASYSDRHCVNRSSGLIDADHAEVGAALLDRGDVDGEVVPHPVGHHRVAGLVEPRGRVPLPLDVLDVLGRAELLELLGLDDVGHVIGLAAARGWR